MARPKKCRRVCEFPQNMMFLPESAQNKAPEIILTIDEYESIRLIDKEGLSQERCGKRMQVARTTVQQIYADARKKLADMLVGGLPLRIEGGDYQLCNGDSGTRGCKGCYRQKLNQQYEKSKGERMMRIAVTYENGNIFQHFGHTEQFKVYDVEDGKVTSSEAVSTNGSGHGALVGVLSALRVDVLICGGIGGGAQMALQQAGIKLYGGVSGSADKAVEALLAGALRFDPNVHCDHHDHEHGNEPHACGDHGCENHSCGHSSQN